MFVKDSNVARRLTQVTVAAGALAVLSSSAFAWHPNGVITKGVTNVTAGGTTVVAADTEATAVMAKPGDTLKYTIVIKNDSPTTNSYDDLLVNELTDTLPDGVELVDGQTTEKTFVVKAKQSVTRTITVKVKASAQNGDVFTNGDVLNNKACFKGEATNHERGTQQTGCNVAIVKISVPTPSPTPTPSATPTPTPSTTPTPTPTPTKTPEGKGETLGTSTELPKTGAPALVSMIGLSSMIAASAAYIRSRRSR